ncbi:MAG: hypothetical protein EBY22_09340 [Gammaproteobacteria bacterium]|nr:hypothetical protein [Gammaproteobacteria bacterium]
MIIEKSSNGMTALDWLDQAGTGPFSTEHQTAREKLRAKGHEWTDRRYRHCREYKIGCKRLEQISLKKAARQ